MFNYQYVYVLRFGRSLYRIMSTCMMHHLTSHDKTKYPLTKISLNKVIVVYLLAGAKMWHAYSRCINRFSHCKILTTTTRFNYHLNLCYKRRSFDRSKLLLCVSVIQISYHKIREVLIRYRDTKMIYCTK